MNQNHSTKFGNFEVSFSVALEIFALIGLAALYAARLIYKQYSVISFYEKQGVHVFPGSRRPIVGAVSEMMAYANARKSDEVVEIDTKWLYNNMSKFLDKKESAPEWSGIWLRYLFGRAELFISDPVVAQDVLNNNQIVDKHSWTTVIFSPRLADNVTSMKRSQEQVQRRRAFMNCFSGTSNFNILDQTI